MIPERLVGWKTTMIPSLRYSDSWLVSDLDNRMRFVFTALIQCSRTDPAYVDLLRDVFYLLVSAFIMGGLMTIAEEMK